MKQRPLIVHSDYNIYVIEKQDADYSIVWSCMTSIKEGKKHCPDSKAIDEKFIEQAFIDSFNMLSSKNRDIIEEFLTDMEETLNNLDAANELKRVQKEIESLENKLSKIVDMRVDELIDKETYEAKYTDISGKMEKLKSERLELQISIEQNHDMRKKMRAFREVYEKNEPIKEFDRFVFESVVEEIILGKVDEKGVKKPYFITFILRPALRWKLMEIKRKSPKAQREKRKKCVHIPQTRHVESVIRINRA